MRKNRNVKKLASIWMCMTAAMMLWGCGGESQETENVVADTQQELTEGTENAGEGAADSGETTEAEPRILHFVDAFGENYETEIRTDFPFHDYDLAAFVRQGERVNYEAEGYTCRQGIDVSAYQGNIDWEKVKADGVDFAFVRLGFRGYGEAGNICLDNKFHRNIQKARDAGVDVGVYFFSQAISEEEAVEEAEFVLQQLEGYELQLPVVYDPESIIGDDSRTDGVSGEQFTRNSLAFCSTMEEAGYEVMIYSNMKWQAFELDLARLAEYPIWYADYEPLPQTPYDFIVWQYSESGSVEGIDGAVDLDLWITKKE